MTEEDLQAFTALTEYALNSSSVQLMMGKLLALHLQASVFSIQSRDRIESAASSGISQENVEALKHKFQVEELKLADQLTGQMQNLLQQISLQESYHEQMQKYLAELKQMAPGEQGRSFQIGRRAISLFYPVGNGLRSAKNF